MRRQEDLQYTLALADALSLLVDEDQSLEAVLAQYPAYAEDLRRDLGLALALRRLKTPALVGGRVARLEQRVLNAVPARTQRPRPLTAGGLLGKWAAAIAIVFLLALGTGGTAVAASATSVPGDALYPVKRTWETIILFIAELIGQLDDVWLQLARTRLDEALVLQSRGDDWPIVLDDLILAVENAARLADDSTNLEVRGFALTSQRVLAESTVTEAAEPLLTQALERLERVSIAPADPVMSGPVEVESPTATPQIIVATATDARLTPTSTFTSLPALRLSETPPPTDTPRIPPTATRTPTITPSPTLTSTPTIFRPSETPTATWTALPLPSVPSATPLRPPTNTSGGVNPTRVPPTAIADPEFFVRQTQQAVFMTQTAIAEDPAVTAEARP